MPKNSPGSRKRTAKPKPPASTPSYEHLGVKITEHDHATGDSPDAHQHEVQAEVLSMLLASAGAVDGITLRLTAAHRHAFRQVMPEHYIIFVAESTDGAIHAGIALDKEQVDFMIEQIRRGGGRPAGCTHPDHGPDHVHDDDDVAPLPARSSRIGRA